MYLTFEEYKNYGGTLDEAAFDEYVFEACALIDYYTFNRLHNRVWLVQEDYPPGVKRCVYKLIKIAQLKAAAMQIGQNEASGGSESSSTTTTTPVGIAIQSQSNDGVSISYNVMSASEAFEQSKTEAYKCMQTYLSGIFDVRGRGLMYRGLYPGEEWVKR